MPQSISPDIVRVCKVCGEPFHPTARKQYCCNKDKVIHCIVCGKDIHIKCNTDYHKQTCSPECAAEVIKTRRKASANQTTKICKWCGKEFVPDSARDVYCKGTHFQICEVCGKEFEIDVRTDRSVRSCSPKCKAILQAKNRDFDREHQHQVDTMMTKYGVDNPAKLPSFRESAKATNRQKYGADWYTQTKEYAESVRNTSVDKYGVEHFLQSEEIKSKRKDTCRSRYGVDNAAKTDLVRSKIRSTWVDKYGVINVSQRHIANKEAWDEFVSNPRSYILSHYTYKPTISKIASDLGVCFTSIYNYISINDNSDLVAHSQSYMEEEVIEVIKHLNPSVKVLTNIRRLIYPYELDIYLPEYKLAVECNPTVTHNSSVSDPWGGEPKSPSYHKAKTDACESARIQLFHIFGYEWTHKRDIIESMLRNLLGKNQNKIFARDTIVEHISTGEANEFLTENHRQGYAMAKVELGLRDKNNRLVSVMTFGRPRRTIGDGKYDYELIRFCNLRDTLVVGGASKLFKYFVKQYHPESIVSFSDRARTCGNLYKVLGFNEIRRSDPGYVWVDAVTDIAYNRVNAQKHNIKKFLGDDTIDLAKTEREIMIEHGFVQVYDSGTITWRWKSA